MRHLALLLMLSLFSSQALCTSAEARHAVRTTAQRRTMVEVHDGWPLSRSARSVVIHAPRSDVRAAVATFLPHTPFGGAAIADSATPTRDRVTWEDGETLDRGEDWTQFTLGVSAQGRQMLLEIAAGRAQLDWAEIVYENGEAQVVDFGEKTYVPGLYWMIDLPEGRALDHIRVVGRARTDEARVTLRMVK